MNQMTIFEAIEDKPKKVGLLHRCHLYKGNEIAYTAFPSRKGMKLLGIRTTEALNMTVKEYEAFKAYNNLEEVKR